MLTDTLSLAGCRGRLQRLRDHLEERRLDAALVSDPRHVHYFTGFWGRVCYAPLLCVARKGPAVLSVPYALTDETAADEVLVYESNRVCTLVDDQWSAAFQPLAKHFRGVHHLGADAGLRPHLLSGVKVEDLLPQLYEWRRAKDADEIGLIRRAIAATEAAYKFARRELRAGRTEVQLFAGMQAAAAEYAGEIIGEFGNDFQIGTLGSAPRRRAGEDGEVAIFDLSVCIRGYHSDMCRSFAVGDEPSSRQELARGRILEALELVKTTARPAASCRELFETAHRFLNDFEGWKFFHHLGHGVGLNGHERPRLNPAWDDTFQVGDVFAAEPGLYGEDLRAGLRIEEMYLVTATGVEQLTGFPTEL